MSGTHPDLDVSGNEPDYFTRFADILDEDKFYQVWAEMNETTIEEKEKDYVNHSRA